MSIVSLVTIENLPVQITLSIYTFKYTHTTQGIYNTMTDEVMDAEMSEWVWTWWRWHDSDDTDYDGAILPYFRQTR